MNIPAAATTKAPAMAIYYIKITTAQGRREQHHALYLSGIEAVLQTLADWPDARSISAICVKRAT